MPLFRSSSKGPKEVVSELREALLYLTQQQTTESKWPKKQRRVSRKHEPSDADLTKAAGEECAALLTSLKSILLAADGESVQKSQLDELVKQCYDAEVLLHLVRASVLEDLPSPEARRNIVRIFRYFLEQQTDNTIKYIIKNQTLISNLISGYASSKPIVVANCGLMLRACSRYKSLVWVILLLKSDDVLQFFDFMQSKQFEVLSDAFVTFKELLRHEDLTAKFLEENQEEVFQRLSEVLSSDFYATKHVGLEWLQQLLSESSCMREYYYSSSDNLKTVMTLLGSDPSLTIRFKALDLMQGFLTITEKEREVREILLENQEKLNALVVELLTRFDKDEKHCPQPGRKFLLRTLEDPELSPALLELLPIETHMNEEELQPETLQESSSEQPPSAEGENESEQQPQDEQSPDQPYDQQPQLHVKTDEEHPDEQSQEQAQTKQPNEHQHATHETEEPLADQPNEEQPQIENSHKNDEQEEQLNGHHLDDSDHPETEEHLANQLNQEQPQIEKPNQGNDQLETEEPHSKVENQEQPQTEELPLKNQHDLSDPLEIEVSLADHVDEYEKEQPQIKLPNKDTETEEPLPLYSELETQEQPLEHQHEGEEQSPDHFDHQKNEESSLNLSDIRESLSDQPDNEPDNMGGKEPLQLPDIEEMSFNQQTEDEPENEEQLIDHSDQHKDDKFLLEHTKPLPAIEEELSAAHQQENKLPTLGLGPPQEETLTKQSDKKALPSTAQAEEHLHKLLAQLQDIITKQPAVDEPQPEQQLDDSTEPACPSHEIQELEPLPAEKKVETTEELLTEPSEEEMPNQLQELQDGQLQDNQEQPEKQDLTKEFSK